MKKNILLFLSMMFGVDFYASLYAHPIIFMPGYENEIQDGRVLQNSQGNFEVQFLFSDQDPYCNYLPVSFAESNHANVARYFIPLNNFDEEVVDSLIQEVAQSCRAKGIDATFSLCDAPCSGVECLFVFEDGFEIIKKIEDNCLIFIISSTDKDINADWQQRDRAKQIFSHYVAAA
jgi:hypothetical protein